MQKNDKIYTNWGDIMEDSTKTIILEEMQKRKILSIYVKSKTCNQDNESIKEKIKRQLEKERNTIF